MLERHLSRELEAQLKIQPVVLLTGARQTGKTTLVESLSGPFTYVTFDNELSLANAFRDPTGWLDSLPKPLIIDEIQRFPEIFLNIKRDVDLHRIPGRYLLTGSANPLLLPRLGDSLTGRMGIATLFPFSQGEINQHLEHFIPKIFGTSLAYQKYPPLALDAVIEKMLKGGFPVVQQFSNPEDVNRWVRAYLQTLMERDVRDIANVEGLREFPRLFRLLATRSSQLLNISDLSRSLGMVNVTLNRYLRLLETLYFIYLLPGWYSNLGKRIIKSPKLHLIDTSIMAQLLEVDHKRLIENPQLAGQFLESFVFGELLKQKSWSSLSFDLYHFRDGNYEVDFVLERPEGTLVGIDVKCAKTLRQEDLKGLKHLKSLTKNFKRGIILHLGSQIEPLGEDLWAFPLQALWD